LPATLEVIALASAKSERLISMPSRGVFAEGKLGHCNISEEIDNTRFWDWQSSPIPVTAPDISAVTPITPQPQGTDVTPTPLPASLLNIVNPSPAPDPTGLAAALSMLGTPNIFRDMSGRAEVADLLKKLSDNTIGIAEAANRARQIQQKYGPSGSTGGDMTASGIGGPRAKPSEPSRAIRDLQDAQPVLKKAVDNNLTTPEKAQDIFSKAAEQSLAPSLQLGFAISPLADWRDLARQKVPWVDWPFKQKLDANDDYQAASRRLASGSEAERLQFMDADNGLFEIIDPYKADVIDLLQRMGGRVVEGAGLERRSPPFS